MKFLVLALIMILGASALKLESHTRSEKNIQELQSSKWGRTLLNMAELHSLAGGPVDQLVQGVEELLADLQNDLQELEFNFSTRTNQHNALVTQLTQEMQDAQIDVSRADDLMDNLLKPRRLQIKKNIQQLQEYQNGNRKNLKENTLVRGQEKEVFEQLLTEYNEATGAVDDALALMGTLSNPSLVQVQKFQRSLMKVENSIKTRHTQHSVLIKAIILLATEQNFADQGVIGMIVSKLNEFRSSVVDAINAATQDEALAVEEFADRVAQLDAEFAEFGRKIVKHTMDLTATQQKIEDTLAFQAQRQADLKAYTAQLELESAQYAEETELFTNLKNQALHEIAVSEQAYQLITSADFSNIKV